MGKMAESLTPSTFSVVRIFPLRASLAPDQLHGDESHPVGFVDLVNHRNVGVLELGSGARLLHEPAAALRVRDQLGRQHLQSHFPVELQIDRPINDPHAPAAQLFQYLVVDQDALVEAMFAGPKAALRPVYEAALKAAKSLGKDITASARKTYVTLARKRQFAVIQPTTATRLDLGLVLPGVKSSERLQRSRNVGGGRVTHAIALGNVADLDSQTRKWLKAAYDQDT
jgi:predicted transport protein